MKTIFVIRTFRVSWVILKEFILKMMIICCTLWNISINACRLTGSIQLVVERRDRVIGIWLPFHTGTIIFNITPSMHINVEYSFHFWLPEIISSLMQIYWKIYSHRLRSMQVSFKIRNQLTIKPEIFNEGIAKLGEDDLFLGTTFRSYVSKAIETLWQFGDILSKITTVLKT